MATHRAYVHLQGDETVVTLDGVELPSPTGVLVTQTDGDGPAVLSLQYSASVRLSGVFEPVVVREPDEAEQYAAAGRLLASVDADALRDAVNARLAALPLRTNPFRVVLDVLAEMTNGAEDG